MTVRPWTRIPVALQAYPHAYWRCRLGWHRVRFISYDWPRGSWGPEPTCTRCRGVAVWWLRERQR